MAGFKAAMLRGNADGVTSSNFILFTQQFWKS